MERALKLAGTLPVLPLCLSLLSCFVVTPIVRKVALSCGAVVRPNSRSVHQAPVPHLGALGIYTGILVGAFLAYRAGWFSRGDGMISPEQLKGILIGAAFIMALGIVDDCRPLSARAKFAGQIAIAVITTCYFGIRVEFVTNPFGGFIVFGALALPVTVFWIVSIVNIVNLIDGLDGLAAGVIAIASFVLLAVAVLFGQPSVVAATAVLAGSTLGFLPYNFNPARIFMGDAGAMLLGYVIACIAALGTMKSAATIALAVPCLALGLPIFDTAYAIVRRMAAGRPIYEADRAHIHHRLLEKGWSQRRVVLTLYGVSSLLGLSSIALAELGPRHGLPAVVLSMLVLAWVGFGLGAFSTGQPTSSRGTGSRSK